ncbi:MAG: S46 family peptidase [Saprospiraceae bacterium]|nr:S46 family peptidase [Saprospiraceae bacterium]
MNKISKKLSNLLILSILVNFVAFGQDPMATPKRFDFGKMWTFENPPKAWFKEAYNFTPEDKWYDDVRKSSLRFASWCSASFVSPNGLIMTNHHCSRDVVTALQKEGENFDKDGFYAATLADERKSDGLFVEQLIMVADVSERILKEMNKAKDDNERKIFQDSALAQAKRDYEQMDAWKGLRIQTVTYYSGGRFSLYGYKKFGDIRLVMIPETDLGFFGGDPDNFTYPRYTLDYTFWRAYDENGNPLNTSAHYFKFNPNGISENEPVFVIGNPGNTERYRTHSQLEYDRDYRFPLQVDMLTNRINILQKEYDANPNVDLQNDIFGLANSQKAFGGILGGLRNPSLIARKKAMEDDIRKNTKIKGEDPWLELSKAVDALKKHASLVTLGGPGGIKGAMVNLIHALGRYEKTMDTPDNAAALDKIKGQIRNLSKEIGSEKEKQYFITYLEELKKYEHPENKFMDQILDGKSAEDRVSKILKKTDFTDADKLEKLLSSDSKKFKKTDDPILEIARIIVPKYNAGVEAFQNSTPRRRALEAKIANNVFAVKGSNLPPDATFTLRLADGKVMGYNYNGTKAPYMTTYYGLYDRHFSNSAKFPWGLPARWQNPPQELLKAPLNFVATNDIIGGNSGSPIINRNKEAVGLIFDGNIESLPGNFIYDETANRSVCVHAGGIMAALKYIYRADRLYDELTGK